MTCTNSLHNGEGLCACVHVCMCVCAYACMCVCVHWGNRVYMYSCIGDACHKLCYNICLVCLHGYSFFFNRLCKQHHARNGVRIA